MLVMFRPDEETESDTQVLATTQLNVMKAKLSEQLKRKLLIALCVSWGVFFAAYLLAPDPQPLMGNGRTMSVAASADADMKRPDLPRSPYADWVHAHWVAARIAEVAHVLGEYRSKRIPVDVVTLQDDFVFGGSATRAQLKTFLAQLESTKRRSQLRVVVYVDGIVPEGTAEFEDAKRKGYLANAGATVEVPAHWGTSGRRGGIVLFTNHDAAQWYSMHLNGLLKMGIDGFNMQPLDAILHAQRIKAHQRDAMDVERFSAAYYYEIFDFGRLVTGFDFVCVFRPVDSFDLSHFVSLGPQDISLASRVASGNRPGSFAGLQDALLHVLHSADRGYINVGMEIGPHSFVQQEAGQQEAGQASTSRQELFLRWAQIASWTPFMDMGVLRPWELCSPAGPSPSEGLSEEQCLDKYRSMVLRHRELRPYLLATGSMTFLHKISDERHNKASQHITTSDRVATKKRVDHTAPFVIMSTHNQEFLLSEPDAWDYLLGADVFVAPVFNASQRGSERRQVKRVVKFPSFGQWVAVSDGGHRATMDVYPAQTVTDFDVALGESLVFQRRGSVIPLEDASTGSLKFVVPYPQEVRQSSLAAKYVMPQLSSHKVIPVLSDTGASDATEFAVVLGEHDHGMVLSYATRRDDERSTLKAFFMDIKATPYHRVWRLHLQHVKCVDDCKASLESLAAAGFHPVAGTDIAAFELSLQRSDVNGQRRVFFGEHDIMLFDPFPSMGTQVSLGPFTEY